MAARCRSLQEASSLEVDVLVLLLLWCATSNRKSAACQHNPRPQASRASEIDQAAMPPRTARRRGTGGEADGSSTERLKAEIKEGPQQAYEALQTARALFARWEGQGQAGRARAMGAELAKAFAEAGCVCWRVVGIGVRLLDYYWTPSAPRSLPTTTTPQSTQGAQGCPGPRAFVHGQQQQPARYAPRGVGWGKPRDGADAAGGAAGADSQDAKGEAAGAGEGGSCGGRAPFRLWGCVFRSLACLSEWMGGWMAGCCFGRIASSLSLSQRIPHNRA